MPLEKGNSREVISVQLPGEKEESFERGQVTIRRGAKFNPVTGKTTRGENKTKDEDFGTMARHFLRKPVLTAAKDAVLNWAGGRYEYKPGGKGDKSKSKSDVSGI